MPFFALAGLWKPMGLAALLCAALGYRAFMLHQLNTARNEAARNRAEAVDLRASNSAFQAEIKRQNDAITAMAARAQAAQAAAVEREAKAAALGQAAETRSQQAVRALLRAPIDAGCAGAIAWANRTAQELAQW